MKHSSLWILMAGSFAAGVLMVFGGSAAGSDIGQLAAGYGLLVIGSSLFLGFGLALVVAIPMGILALPGDRAGHPVPGQARPGSSRPRSPFTRHRPRASRLGSLGDHVSSGNEDAHRS